MTENLLTYTEVDPASRMSESLTRVTFTNLAENDSATYLYVDKGSNHFSGDFTHKLDFYWDASTDGAQFSIWTLQNTAEGYRTGVFANRPGLDVYLYRGGATYYIYLREVNDLSHIYEDSGTINIDTTYYLKIVRDETVGTYGTLYCYIYSDSSRTTLVDTLSLTLHAKTDFRYVMPINTWRDGSTNTESGYVENLNLGETGDLQLNIGDAFKSVQAVQINIGDTWKTVTHAQVNIGDTWKTIF